MNKNIFIGIGVVMLMVLVVLIGWSIFGKTVPIPDQPLTNPYPLATSTVAPPVTTGDTLTLVGAHGEKITLKNFLLDPETVRDPVNKGYMYLGNHFPLGDVASSTTPEPPYVIQYIESTQYFNIALLQEPLGATRLQAEQYLIEHLGIPREQLCNLNYMVSVPNYVNTQRAGDSLGFSVCSGSLPL